MTRQDTPQYAQCNAAPTAIRRARGGYALLLTLVMLAITAVTLGTLASTSGTQARRAQQAQHDLQARWAEASCRRVLMPALRDELASRQTEWRSENPSTVSNQAPTSAAVSLDLLGVHLVARLDDQQALANLNHLLRPQANGQPREVAGALMSSTIRERLMPRPLETQTAQQLSAQPYTAWGQLYPTASPQQLSGLDLDATPSNRLIVAAANVTPSGSSTHGPGITLWGDGRLNVWTASPESLHLALDDLIGSPQVAELIDLRLDRPDLSARQLVQTLNLGPSERAAAQLVLTDQSDTYAMWLAVTPTQEGKPAQDRRPQWSLTIAERKNRSLGSRHRVFRW